MLRTMAHSVYQGHVPGPVSNVWRLCLGADTDWMVRDKMMYVVTALPPTYGHSTAEVGNKDTDQSIYDEIVCDAPVACIMCSKHDLMLKNHQYCRISEMEHGRSYPEQPKKGRRSHVPFRSKAHNKHYEEESVSDELLAVFDIVAIVEAFCLDPVVQLFIFHGNLALSLLV